MCMAVLWQQLFVFPLKKTRKFDITHGHLLRGLLDHKCNGSHGLKQQSRSAIRIFLPAASGVSIIAGTNSRSVEAIQLISTTTPVIINVIARIASDGQGIPRLNSCSPEQAEYKTGLIVVNNHKSPVIANDAPAGHPISDEPFVHHVGQLDSPLPRHIPLQTKWHSI